MATQTHTTVIANADIIRHIESRTFKFGKARESVADDKLINDVKLTDIGYDRDLVYGWIDIAIGNIVSSFSKYSSTPTSTGTGDGKTTNIQFVLPSTWDAANGGGFDADCKEYVTNMVIFDFLSLSLPKEADIYGQKATAALKNAERKLYYKHA